MADYYIENRDFWETAWTRVKNLYKKPTETEYLEELPKGLKEYGVKTVLDIACGSGWLAVYLNSFGFKSTGIDISEAAIKLAHRWIEEENLKDIEFFMQDMMDMDFPDDHFDAIVISSSLEHLNKERAAEFFIKAKRVVKPDGILFGCFDHVCVGDKGEFTTLDDGTRVYTDTVRKGMLLRNYSTEELQDMMKETNWEIFSINETPKEARLVWAKNKK